MNRRRRQIWRAASGLVVLLSLISFTPLVLNSAGPHPMLFGIPHTLWAGMLIAFLLVALTVVGAYAHPGQDDTEGSA